MMKSIDLTTEKEEPLTPTKHRNDWKCYSLTVSWVKTSIIFDLIMNDFIKQTKKMQCFCGYSFCPGLCAGLMSPKHRYNNIHF